MKPIITIILIVIFLYACNMREKKYETDNNKTLDSASNKPAEAFIMSKKVNISFFYDNLNYSKFGVKFFENDLPIGQQDIMLDNGKIYVLDRFFNNIKILDRNGELLMHISPLSEKQLWLKQIAMVKDNIIVISELDSIYIFDKNLSLIERKFLKKGNGRIFLESNDKLVLYYPLNGHEFVEINKDGKIISTLKGLEYKSKYPSLIDFPEKGVVKYDGKIYYYPENLVLQDKIFDINNNIISYYNQDNDSLRLSILHFEPR